MNAPWSPFLERYLSHAANYYEKVRGVRELPRATPEQLSFLRAESKRQGLIIDPGFEALLATVNGTGFNGLQFFGVQIPEDDMFGRTDIFYLNLLIDERENNVLYGGSGDEFYVRVAATGTFERRSIVGWEPYFQYETCDEMIAAILEEEAGNLDELHGVP